MSRTVLLLDVTAMAADAACIAGIDLKSNAIVRLAEPQPTKRLLDLLGGITPGDVINIDYKEFRKTDAPHVEDCEWTPRSLKKRRRAQPDEVEDRLRGSAFPSVSEAFGTAIEIREGRNAASLPNTGVRSLATVQARDVRLRMSGSGRPRISFIDKGGAPWPDVPYQDVQAGAHLERCSVCRAVLNQNHEVRLTCGLIRVGLTRPYSVSEASPPLCWLQVTSVLSNPPEHLV